VPIVKVNSKSRIKIFSSAAYILAALILVGFNASLDFGQTSPPQRSTPPPPPRIDGTKNPDDPPLTTFEEEIRAKREIKMAEKDHQQNLDRAREIAEIGKQLKESSSGKANFDGDYLKKIERLEKLTKKIRGEAGGDDQDVSIPHQPSDLPSALAQISEAAESLSKEVEKTPRRVVSASVICNANVLLELIRVARSFAHPQP
jgi:hypothetical protein